jgi:hypothetical protein
MSRSLLLACALLAASAAGAAAQVKAGPEFQANTFTAYNQFIYSMTPVAIDPAGNFVVVWQSAGQEPDFNYGIYGQRFDRTGARVGAEFHVNSYSTNYQGEASVAALGEGRFVVAWESTGPDGGLNAVRARFFGLSGPLSPEFTVNTYTPGSQVRPALAAAADGRFVVAWHDLGQDGSGYGIYAQRYDAAGAAVGGEFHVSTYTVGHQSNESVGMAPGGEFLIAWSSQNQDGSSVGVYAQRYDAAGVPQGAEFRVNSYTTGYQGRPAVSAGGGGFVVVWHSGGGQDGNNYGVFGQRLDAGGAFLGGEFQANTYTFGPDVLPHVAADRAGNFTVIWTQYPSQDGNSEGIFGQRFLADGARRGGEFQVNTYTFTNQDYGAPAVDDVGNFVVVWSSRNLDGPASEAAAGQRFGGLLPAGLAVDESVNRVLDPGVPEEIKPSWRNVNGATQAFGSAGVRLSGPAGGTYTITDATASYGSVPSGAVAACTDCLAVNVGGTRPALHWDATLDERITPDAHGQQRAWLLHVGGSFSDMGPSNPFYRFTETLLHHGVTGGCGGTLYCPTASTTRAQMAVFVLVAKEGAGYAPPACGAPMFSDVPAASPFCRWIEELARRGVAGGCGGGRFCPDDAVTREQLAVFVLRTLDPALDPPACAPPNLFNDVPETSSFCRWIEELANRMIVAGCGGGAYCPQQPVTREQMGVFLSLTFALTLYGL